MIYVSQTIILYILNLYRAECQLYLNYIGGKKNLNCQNGVKKKKKPYYLFFLGIGKILKPYQEIELA